MKIILNIVAIFSFSTTLFASAYDLKSLENNDLVDICSQTCGTEYNNKAEVRKFNQLKNQKEEKNQYGLVCFKEISWAEENTPCHTRKAQMGIMRGKLATSKTEIHEGGWAKKQGGAWCIAYNESDFEGMARAIDDKKIVPGQVACTSGIKLGSY